MIRKNTLFWAIAYIGIIAFVCYDFLDASGDVNSIETLKTTLFKPQKFFLNVNIAFITLLYTFRIPYTSPLLIMRCQKNYFNFIIVRGVKIVAFFVAVTMAAYHTFIFYYGYKTNFSWEEMIYIIILSVFSYQMYLMYIFVSIRTGNTIYGLTVVVTINFILLVIESVRYSIGRMFSLMSLMVAIEIYSISAGVLLLYYIKKHVKNKEILAN